MSAVLTTELLCLIIVLVFVNVWSEYCPQSYTLSSVDVDYYYCTILYMSMTVLYLALFHMRVPWLAFVFLVVEVSPTTVRCSDTALFGISVSCSVFFQVNQMP